jgi:hypothetical protein
MKTKLLSCAAAALMLAIAPLSSAQAGGRHNGDAFAYGLLGGVVAGTTAAILAAPRAVVAQPTYVAPAPPVYYAPPPVVYAPPPVYYVAPPPPVVYAPAPVYYGYGWHRHW